MRPGHLEYKQKNMSTWNEVAPRYHKRWARADMGPAQSTARLIKLTDISKGDMVLDIACGTGVVTKKIQREIGKDGYVVGVDTSITAIKIAKRWNGKRANLDFVNADAEKFYFSKKFDIVTCQYALFFFPNAQRALKNMRRSLKESGRIGITVHGSMEKVPFFSSILDSVTEFIPDYIPPDSPDLGRFSTRTALREEVGKAGFSKMSVKEFVFHYSPGRFEDYWRGYIRYLSKPLKEKLDALEHSKRREFRQSVRENTVQYTRKDSRIVFPWQVLILTAKY